MSVLNTLPAPVIQMGLVEKIVEVQQNQPYVQQQVAQESARQALDAAKSRVAGLDQSELGKKVREKSEEQGGGGQRHSRSHSRKDETPAPEDTQGFAAEAEAEPPRTKPWSGYIVNLKI